MTDSWNVLAQVAMSAEKQKEKLLGVTVTDEIASALVYTSVIYALNDSSNIKNIETRTFIAKKLPGTPVVEYTVTVKESLLMGPGGGLVVESIWDGNRLLTVILKGW